MAWALLAAFAFPLFAGLVWSKKQEVKWARVAIKRGEKPMTYSDFPKFDN